MNYVTKWDVFKIRKEEAVRAYVQAVKLKLSMTALGKLLKF